MDFTKSQICKTAKELFNRRRYQSVSMRQIAGAAGISLGTLILSNRNLSAIGISNGKINTPMKVQVNIAENLNISFKNSCLSEQCSV